jgi:DNA-binding transcriptional MocR family regulator
MTKFQVAQVSVPEGWIDFGIGQPQIDILPLDLLAKATEHRMAHAGRDILQYGWQQGDEGFRNSLAQFLSTAYGKSVNPDHLFITAGISQALDLICALHTRPGDTVIVEEPSYFLALRIFADYKLNIIGTPIDDQGINIGALEDKIAQHKPVFVYTIPAFHNPAGVTLSEERRAQLVSLSEKHDFFIVADEVYQMLAYRGAVPPPMIYFDTSQRVLSLGSFSKILAPGLRLGWMQANPDLLEPFIVCGYLDSGGGLNPFVSAIVHSVLELGLQDEFLNFLKETYLRRRTALSNALRHHIPSLSFSDPDGGYFIWSCFPDGMDAEALLPEARKLKVGFQPGIKFSSTNGLRNYLRFCFAYYSQDALVEGVERLASAIS